ncbi:proteasome activator subunit 4 [Colletotrichum cuscutae]|uniref:Proteasome activator subunit 4 n=1 Tax=Colletotrichum cuscutae TaxID=1209917 RepID=A0AAI9Y6E0_9PEZI|nr:proteasome activator subunit 4 [Colletotrichum cuscutae]
MGSPLEQLLEAAAKDSGGIVQPTYRFSADLCYRTKGETNRKDGLKTILTQLYYSVTKGEYQGAVRWTEALTHWITLEHGVPRKVRAALTRIYYDLALTPGMESTSAMAFSDIVPKLVYDMHGERCLEQGKDINLDWRPLFDRMKFDRLHTDTTFNTKVSFDRLARVARHFFEPRDKVAMLEIILPYFDGTGSSAAVEPIKMAVLLSPTAPAPESFLDCQPSRLIPMYCYLWSKSFRMQAAISAMLEHFALLAEKHLECTYVSFGPSGIFDRTQSHRMFAAISRLTLVDDKERRDSFNDSPPTYDSWTAAAGWAARWIVFSLSPSCLEQEDSILAGLEDFIASINILYHPNSTAQSRLPFVTQLLLQLANHFCWRYNREKNEQLATPPERRINVELRKRFARLLRATVFSGCFSKELGSRIGCLWAVKHIGNLEPDLVVPTALESFYNSKDSQVDGDSAEFSMSILGYLCSTIARERRLRCHLPTLMDLALPGINASRPHLTISSCCFILDAMCNFPFFNKGFVGPSQPEGFSTADTWMVREIQIIADGESRVDMGYHEQLTNDEEAAILRSASSGAEDFALRFLERALDFASEAFCNDFDADDNPLRDRAQESILDAGEGCFMSLSPQMLEEAMLLLSRRLASDPIPKANEIIKTLVDCAVRADPQKGLGIFMPMLIERIRTEIEERWSKTRNDRRDLLSVDENLCWYAAALQSCLNRGGSELLLYKNELLRLAHFATDKCGPRAFGFSGLLSKYMLRGWTETFTIRLEASKTGEPSRDDQDKTTANVIGWHLPSYTEIQAACEVFESEAAWFEQEIHALLDRHPTGSGAEASITWVCGLTGALDCLSEMVCGMATLFDPTYTQADGSSDACYDSAGDDAAYASFRMQDLHRILEPYDPLYVKIHKRRDAIGVLASEVHAYLLGCEGELIDCLSGVYRLFTTLVMDVGSCNAHNDKRQFREKHERWASRSRISGVAASQTAAINSLLMDRYHAELQQFATGYRCMGDLEKKILQDVIEGCSCPFGTILTSAQFLFISATQHLGGSVEFFLPRMVTKFRTLIQSKKYCEMESALQTLVLGTMNSWWQRRCPSHVPDLLEALAETAALSVPEVPSITILAKTGIKRMGIPDFCERNVFAEEGIVEAIRPAGDDSKAVHRILELVYASKAKVRRQMAALGINLLHNTADSKLRALFVGTLIRVGFDKETPPHVEHISFLAEKATSRDSQLRNECIIQLHRLIGDFLAGIRFNHNFEDFLRTQGTGGRDKTLIVPGQDPGYTERYLAGYDVIANGNEDKNGELAAEFFLDSSFHGSLVWPAQCYAQRRDFVLPRSTPDTALMADRIGALLSKNWFQKFLFHLHLEEEPLEGDEYARKPEIREANVALLTHAFQLMEIGATTAKLEDIEDLARMSLGDGSKIGQHVATATLFLSLMNSPLSRAFRDRVMKAFGPPLMHIITHKMFYFSETWISFVRRLTLNRDPHRFQGLIYAIGSLRLNTSDSGSQSQAKLKMLRKLLDCVGWRFRQGKSVMFMLLQAKDTCLSKDISDAIGKTLARVYTTGFHDSWPDVRTLIAANHTASPLGIQAYRLESDMRNAVTQLFTTISTLRGKNPMPHREYHCASTAALAFIFDVLETNVSESLIPLLALVCEELFLMLDPPITGETDLKALATSVLEKLCCLPFRECEIGAVWGFILQKAKFGPFSHYITAMSMVRVLYLRQLLTSQWDEQKKVLQAVCDRIQVEDLKVQVIAAETLTHLLSRSRLGAVEPIILGLVEDCQQTLKKPCHKPTAKLDTMRLAAIRGLSAVVSAYPQLTISPGWMIEAMELITRENFIAIGLSATIAAEMVTSFKEARRTRWDIVVKNLPPHLVQDMQDIIGPSYYA